MESFLKENEKYPTTRSCSGPPVNAGMGDPSQIVQTFELLCSGFVPFPVISRGTNMRDSIQCQRPVQRVELRHSSLVVSLHQD